jgi:hypothetical protein
MVLPLAKIVRRRRKRGLKMAVVKFFVLKPFFNGKKTFSKNFLFVSNVKLWEIYDEKRKS